MDETNDFSSDEIQDEVEALTQFFGTAKEVVNRYSYCAHCGGHLHFSHLTDFSRNLTEESARCPECGIKVRKLIHRLQ